VIRNRDFNIFLPGYVANPSELIQKLERSGARVEKEIGAGCPFSLGEEKIGYQPL